VRKAFTKPGAPASDRLVRDGHTALEEQPEPGTTSAWRMRRATLRPRTTRAALRRSSIRALVHEPGTGLALVRTYKKPSNRSLSSGDYPQLTLAIVSLDEKLCARGNTDWRGRELSIYFD
jgi:hypothetical protein